MRYHVSFFCGESGFTQTFYIPEYYDQDCSFTKAKMQ